jgi:Ca2+-binding EF-hand superfamily protein
MFLLREWFGTVDQDKTGQIDVIKLQTALSASGEKFGENIYFLMIKMFDVDGSHSINFLGTSLLMLNSLYTWKHLR